MIAVPQVPAPTASTEKLPNGKTSHRRRIYRALPVPNGAGSSENAAAGQDFTRCEARMVG
jgi:hypothetical protein